MSAGVIDEKLALYKAIQQEMAELAGKRQIALQQANENGMVQQELESLDASSASVYKMMGPVLLRVELEDARQNVAKRLELIKTQMEEVEAKVQAKQKEADELGSKIMEQQRELQAKTAEAVRAAAASALAGAGAS